MLDRVCARRETEADAQAETDAQTETMTQGDTQAETDRGVQVLTHYERIVWAFVLRQMPPQGGEPPELRHRNHGTAPPLLRDCACYLPPSEWLCSRAAPGLLRLIAPSRARAPRSATGAPLPL